MILINTEKELHKSCNGCNYKETRSDYNIGYGYTYVNCRLINIDISDCFSRNIRHKLCPLIELKNKEIKWEKVCSDKIEYTFKTDLFLFQITATNENNECVLFVQFYKKELEEYVFGKGFHVFETLDNAIKFCNRIYNKIFYDFLGGEK